MKKPSRRTVLHGAAATALVACSGPSRGLRSTGVEPRNVVLIITDDQRADAFSFMGHRFLRTPALDGLVAEGAWCEHAFVTTSLCCPSRASMLTGLWAHQHGVLDNQSELPSEVPTYAQHLAGAGIDTCYIGKWHMGAANPHPRPGWQRWIGFRGQGRYTYPGPAKLPPLDRGFSYDGTFREVSGYVTDLLTDEAVAYLEEPRRRNTPFCMVVAHKAVHAPFAPADRHASALEGPVPDVPPLTEETQPTWMRAMRGTEFDAARPYGAFPDFEAWYRAYHRTLLAVDESTGRIVHALKRIGLAERTVVLFVSDNGFMEGERGVLDKRNAYESSIRVPWLAWGPGTVPAGAKVSELVLNVDVAPTVLDLLGYRAPASMQGRSVAPLLRGEAVADWREDFLYEYFHERRFPTTPTVRALRTRRHKLITYHGVPDGPELYDLERDPAEQRNAWGRMPKIRADLQARLAERMEALGLLAEPVWARDRVR